MEKNEIIELLLNYEQINYQIKNITSKLNLNLYIKKRLIVIIIYFFQFPKE